MRYSMMAGGILVMTCFAYGEAPTRLASPVHLMAGGRPVDVERIGHAAPSVGDFDGDGVKDLLVGQYDRGRLRIYRNVGSNLHPRFDGFKWFEAGGQVAEVPIACCTSFTPLLVDFDGDGQTDILSGSWPGTLYLFLREQGVSFRAGRQVQDRRGKLLNVGRGAVPVAVDWDGDGDLDLIVGNVTGEVYFIPNESGGRKHAFGLPVRLTVDETPIEVQGGCAAPAVADWDGDSKLDLLIGSSDGSVVWHRNVGSTAQPVLAGPVTLVDESPLGWKEDRSRLPGQWGVRARIWVTDWNEDGDLDLLLGDYCGGFVGKPRQTESERAEERDALNELPELQKAWTKVFAAYRQLVGQRAALPASAASDRAQRLGQYREQLATIKEKIATAQETQQRYAVQRQAHGFVWLFLRERRADR